MIRRPPRSTRTDTLFPYTALGQIIRGDRGADELGGPIRIADMSGQAAELGIGTLIYFAAVLSINLGLINLFPVPMLDGGHLLFYAVERSEERRVGTEWVSTCRSRWSPST